MLIVSGFFKYKNVYLYAVPIYSILFLYNLNSSEVHFIHLLFPLFISCVIVLFISYVTYNIFKSFEKASLISFLTIFIFFNFGSIYDFCIHNSIPLLQQGRWLFLFFIILLLLIIFFIVKNTKIRKLVEIINFLKIIYTSLLFLVITSIIYNNFKKDSYVTPLAAYKYSGATNFNGNIYYIICDGYASFKTSISLHGFDNSIFYDSLKSIGFEFPEKSKSNYSITFLSLSSSLNMDYLHNLIPNIIETGSNSTNDLQNLIQNPLIFQKFKLKGYKIYNISSGWGPTSFINSANVNLSSLFLSPFYYEWGQFTIFRPLIQRKLYESRSNNIHNSFSELEDIEKLKNKNFIFSHIISPHRPYLFNENGEIVKYKEADFTSYKSHVSKYYAQVKFLNNELLRVIKKILQNSKTKPIIILQSDHGSDMYFKNSNIKLSISEPLRSIQIMERTENLNAIYLPYKTKNTTKLIKDLTPVNTFRFIFNEFFNDTLPYKKNEVFYSDYYNLFRFTKIKY
jgi:hypothetical protein